MDTDDKRRHEVAMARFAMIAPVINNTFTEKSAACYFRRVAEDPLVTLDGTCRHYSPRTYEDWIRAYKKRGIEGLMPKGRSDAGQSRKLTEEAVSALYALKNRFPKMNATIMYERLIEDGIIRASEVSLSTVQRFAKQAFNTPLHKSEGRDRRAFEAEYVNGIWQADTLYGPYMENPKKRAYVQTIIDDKSRVIVASRAVFSDNATTFQTTLKAAIARFGLPERLYVDNGSAYRNDQLAMICGQLGIVLLHAPVRDGAAKGKIERANRTLRSRFLNILEKEHLASIEVFGDALGTWVQRYNTTSHSSIEARPLDIFSKEAGTLRRPVCDTWLDECFLNRIERKVSRDGCVRVLKRDYDCPCSYIGLTVSLRYDPTCMDSITLYDGDARIECFPTDRVANAKMRRAKHSFTVDYTKGDQKGDE